MKNSLLKNPFDRHDKWPLALRGMRNIAVATLVFGVWHSLLCSTTAKETAKTVLGQRKGAALYRLFFMIQSVLTSGALILLVLTQPHRVIYRARGWNRVLGWTGQAGSLTIAFLALREMDKSKFVGLGGIRSLRNDQENDGQPITEAEAQGPDIEDGGEVRETGIFRFSRHPLDWAPILLLWSSPTLKTNWLTFNVLAAIYAVVGARHEESRLLRRNKTSYESYQKRVPFFFGWPRNGASEE